MTDDQMKKSDIHIFETEKEANEERVNRIMKQINN